MSASKPSVVINGRQMNPHHGWVVKQAVILMAARIKEFKDLGADGPIIEDCTWMLDDVLKAMSPEAAQPDPAG